MRKSLLEQKNVYDLDGTSDMFLEAMREVVSWHCKRNSFYKDLLEKNNITPESIKTESDLAKLPTIPANFFKTYESLSIPREDVVVHVTSSGTAGQKSQMFFDQDSWDFGQMMIQRTLDYFGFVSDNPANYILYTYEPASETGSNLGTAKTDEGLLQYALVNEFFYSLRHNGEGHDFDVYGTIETLVKYENQGLPVRIFGFPSFLYFTLTQMKKLNMKPLKLNPESMTMFGGGWKGNADKQIPKRELYTLIEEMLGIPQNRCRDGYGSTEHSVPYFECENHNFHIPIYSRMIIRDFKTLKPVGYGVEGFASFVTPHLLSVPGVSVLMGDKAVLHKGEKCGCGIASPYMEILGRAGTSAAKSCAIAASELLKG
jgi:phenylacetate-coenzyme A ligase PaaK-like adenylate-forming protein